MRCEASKLPFVKGFREKGMQKGRECDARLVFMDTELLGVCFARLRGDAAAGIDQVTKEE